MLIRDVDMQSVLLNAFTVAQPVSRLDVLLANQDEQKAMNGNGFCLSSEMVASLTVNNAVASALRQPVH